MLFLASSCWGLSIPVMKALAVEQQILAPHSGTLAASAASLAVRFALAAAAVLLLARRSPFGIRGPEWKHGFILGVITAVSMFLQVDGLNYTSASMSGFLIALYCVLVPVFSWVGGRRRLTPVLFLCCLLVLAGIAALNGFDPRSLSMGRGEWESLAAACLFACQILWVDKVPRDRVDPSRLTFVLCAAVSLSGLAALVFFSGAAARQTADTLASGARLLADVHASARSLWLTLSLALLGTTAPFLIMNRFQARVGAVAAGFIYCIEPLTAALGAFILPQLLVRDPALYRNEELTPRLAVGALLILGANLLLLRDKAGAHPVPAVESLP
jgi:drug/metabolite transporter (DMT)-like permease